MMCLVPADYHYKETEESILVLPDNWDYLCSAMVVVKESTLVLYGLVEPVDLFYDSYNSHESCSGDFDCCSRAQHGIDRVVVVEVVVVDQTVEETVQVEQRFDLQAENDEELLLLYEGKGSDSSSLVIVAVEQELYWHRNSLAQVVAVVVALEGFLDDAWVVETGQSYATSAVAVVEIFVEEDLSVLGLDCT